jgi:hypothetical protein
VIFVFNFVVNLVYFGIKQTVQKLGYKIPNQALWIPTIFWLLTLFKNRILMGPIKCVEYMKFMKKNSYNYLRNTKRFVKKYIRQVFTQHKSLKIGC